MEKAKHKITMAKAFKEFIWPRKYIVLIGLLLIIVSRLASLVLPGASKYLMDNVIVNKDLSMLKWLLIIVA
ncbi:MAG: ABC transporter ATP-binding protein, partial [Ignavibacteriae bacterium]|nr:ABC transporter ATP-binding protein [Ignavibacteriota bacterium]